MVLYKTAAFASAGLVAIANAESYSTSCTNGVCCVNGSTENDVCCPFGDIYGDTCCMTEEGVDGTHYGFIYSSGSCPDGAISIAMDAPNYTSSVSSAASKLGASTAPIFTSTGGATTATPTLSDQLTSLGGFFTLSFTSATATQTGTASATKTEPVTASAASGSAEASSGTAGAGSTSSPGSNSESSTGAAPFVTVAAVPLGLALGVGALLL